MPPKRFVTPRDAQARIAVRAVARRRRGRHGRVDRRLAHVHDRRAVGVELDRRRALEEHRAQHVGPFEQLGGRAVEADLALLHEVRGLGDR